MQNLIGIFGFNAPKIGIDQVTEIEILNDGDMMVKPNKNERSNWKVGHLFVYIDFLDIITSTKY